MAKGEVVLLATDDEHGSRTVRASIRSGDLVIEGQDLGGDVEAFFGASEYEWAYLIPESEIPRALAALGGASRRSIIRLLSDEWRGEKATSVIPTLKQAGVTMEFWSRAGG
jgi:hypothetical protein